MCSFVGRVLACCKQCNQSHFWARADGSTSDPGHRKCELVGGDGWLGLKPTRLVMNMVEMDLIKGDMFSLRKMSMELKIIVSRKKAEELQYEKVRVKIVDQVMKELRLENARRRYGTWLDCRFSWRVGSAGTWLVSHYQPRFGGDYCGQILRSGK